MSTTRIPFPAGHYHYVAGGFQYSAAVMADARRVSFERLPRAANPQN